MSASLTHGKSPRNSASRNSRAAVTCPLSGSSGTGLERHLAGQVQARRRVIAGPLQQGAVGPQHRRADDAEQGPQLRPLLRGERSVQHRGRRGDLLRVGLGAPIRGPAAPQPEGVGVLGEQRGQLRRRGPRWPSPAAGNPRRPRRPPTSRTPSRRLPPAAADVGAGDLPGVDRIPQRPDRAGPLGASMSGLTRLVASARRLASARLGTRLTGRLPASPRRTSAAPRAPPPRRPASRAAATSDSSAVPRSISPAAIISAARRLAQYSGPLRSPALPARTVCEEAPEPGARSGACARPATRARGGLGVLRESGKPCGKRSGVAAVCQLVPSAACDELAAFRVAWVRRARRGPSLRRARTRRRPGRR